MGHNLKVLAERPVDQTLYYDHGCALELRECIHDHVEDFRMIYDEEEFIRMSDHWINARREYEERRRPRCHSGLSETLSNFRLDGQRLHHDRLGIEFVQGGADKDGGGDTIHIHYRNQRIHLSKRDFYRMCLTFEEARRSYNIDYATKIKLSDPNVVLREVAVNEFAQWLREYAEGDVPRAEPGDFWDMFLESKMLNRPEGIQRPDGGWLQGQPRTRDLPEDFNKRYLYTIFECIKKYGYGEGPFKYDYIRAHTNEHGQIEMSGSHRAACLKALGYDEISVVVTN